MISLKKRVYPALCLLLALLTACAPPRSEARPSAMICRRPPAVTFSLMDDPDVDAGWGDLRCADLRDRDLTGMAAEIEAAIGRARSAGIAVVCVNSRDPLLEPWMGMGREPYGDPNDLADVRPGAFWEEYLYSGEYRGADGSLLLVPVDRRTAASPAGEGEYACFAQGGMSWAAPYVAGLFALACQVRPEVTYEEFLAAARATADPVSIRSAEGKEYPYGKVEDPAALLARLGA